MGFAFSAMGYRCNGQSLDLRHGPHRRVGALSFAEMLIPIVDCD